MVVHCCSLTMRIFTKLNKELYIKYVGGAAEILQIFRKKIAAHDAVDLNISWPSNFFEKYFMAPPINFSFLFKAFL